MKRRLQKVAAFVLFLSPIAGAAPALALDEPDRLWLVGERAFADGLYPLARRALERLASEFPRDPRLPDAVLLLGRARLALGDGDAALEAFRRAQSFQPPPGRPLEARFWEGEALFRLKRYPEARAAYDDLLRVDAASPLAPDALYGFGWCELEAKRPEAAVTAWRDFLKAWPEHARAPAATYYLARTLVDLKQLSEALPLLADYGAKYRSSKLAPDARYLLGWTRVATGDGRAGLADLRAFVAAYPNHEEAPSARRLITETAARYGDRDDQIEAYRALMAQEPPTAQALAEAAGLAGRLGRAADQEAAWRKLRAQFPEHPLARRAALDQASAAFKRKEWKDAAALAQAAAQSDDEGVRAEAWLLTGESELKLRRYPGAVKAFEAVGTLKTVEPAVRFRALAGLGLAREEQQELKAALAAYEAVAAKSPDDTLRQWARERAAAVKGRLSKTPAKPAPAQKKPGTTDTKPGSADPKPKGRS